MDHERQCERDDQASPRRRGAQRSRCHRRERRSSAGLVGRWRRGGGRVRGRVHGSSAGTSSVASGTASCLTWTRLPAMTSRPAQNARDGGRQQAMLDREHPRRQRRLVVALQHRDRALRDDRPMVECGRHEVDGAAVKPHAVGQRAAVRVQARDRKAAATDGC